MNMILQITILYIVYLLMYFSYIFLLMYNMRMFKYYLLTYVLIYLHMFVTNVYVYLFTCLFIYVRMCTYLVILGMFKVGICSILDIALDSVKVIYFFIEMFYKV